MIIISDLKLTKTYSWSLTGVTIPPNTPLVFELQLVDTWNKPLYISLEDVVIAN